MEALNQRLRQAVSTIFPDVIATQATFYPLVDLAHADMASEIAFELADKLHQPPFEIAKRILDYLGNDWGLLYEERGYLNLRLSDSALLVKDQKPERRGRGVILAPQLTSNNRAEYFRISALAILQSKMAKALGLDYEIRGFDGEVPTLDRALAAASVPHDAYFDWIKSQLSDRTTICWVTPSMLENSKFLTWAKPHYPHHLQILCAPQDWVNFDDWEEWHPQLRTLIKERESELILLLAGPIPAQDLSLELSYFQERRNTWWYLNSTVDRMVRLQLAPSNESSLDISIPPDFRSLMVRSQFLNDFQFLAASRGQVRDFSTVLDELLSRANMLLNQPDLRVRAFENRLKYFEQYIFTSVQGALSDIVNTLKSSLNFKGAKHGEYASE